MKFIDEVSFTIVSGSGGHGCVSFHREKFRPRGGPDGGDGGTGGSVIFKVNPRLNSLFDLYHKRKLMASNGRPGEGGHKSGPNGKDLIVEIPPGTVIKDETGVIADLQTGETRILKGGHGGKGNVHFATSIVQAPDNAEEGEQGQEKRISLELKMIADVGVIGLPNAGKSTFISKVSAAKPKIADYPFTTLTPQLGVVVLDHEASFVIADIPGLIEGAHKGVGLGIKFLRHIERTAVLLHLIDVSDFAENSAIEAFDIISNELEQFDNEILDADSKALSERTQFVALNKIDSISEQKQSDLVAMFKKRNIEVNLISAVSGKGVLEIINKISKEVRVGDE